MPSPGKDQGALEALLVTELELPTYAYLVPGLLCGMIIGIAIFFPEQVTNGWAISRSSLHNNKINLLLHIFAHGGVVHILLNVAALIVVGPRLIARIGSPFAAGIRFVYVFVGSGLAGAALFVLLNGNLNSSAIGASGAIFGLLGALARVHPATGDAVSILSRRSLMLAFLFVRDHAIMFALIMAALILTGHGAMVAWEAHLGGMLFGLLIAPLFLPRAVTAKL